MKKESIGRLLTRGAVVLLICGAVPCCQAMSESYSSISGEASVPTESQKKEMPGLWKDLFLAVSWPWTAATDPDAVVKEFCVKHKEYLKREILKVESIDALLSFVMVLSCIQSEKFDRNEAEGIVEQLCERICCILHINLKNLNEEVRKKAMEYAHDWGKPKRELKREQKNKISARQIILQQKVEKYFQNMDSSGKCLEALKSAAIQTLNNYVRS
ncbi:MAG: hypothetical protein LBG13_00745 [Holosporales bacterium]|jgi:hypothetical protein|nr:hypothetical protein [Holosporales bacterium]